MFIISNQKTNSSKIIIQNPISPRPLPAPPSLLLRTLALHLRLLFLLLLIEREVHLLGHRLLVPVEGVRAPNRPVLRRHVLVLVDQVHQPIQDRIVGEVHILSDNFFHAELEGLFGEAPLCSQVVVDTALELCIVFLVPSFLQRDEVVVHSEYFLDWVFLGDLEVLYVNELVVQFIVEVVMQNEFTNFSHLLLLLLVVIVLLLELFVLFVKLINFSHLEVIQLQNFTFSFPYHNSVDKPTSILSSLRECIVHVAS